MLWLNPCMAQAVSTSNCNWQEDLHLRYERRHGSLGAVHTVTMKLHAKKSYAVNYSANDGASSTDKHWYFGGFVPWDIVQVTKYLWSLMRRRQATSHGTGRDHSLILLDTACLFTSSAPQPIPRARAKHQQEASLYFWIITFRATACKSNYSSINESHRF